MNKTGLTICPETELKFIGPFDKVNVAHLRLTNSNDKNVLFKIKTTAPKKYCVRPNCGSIPPNETLKVMIALQPFEYDPNEKNKHKFMVQSLVAPEESSIEQTFYDAAPDQVTEMKLRCVFELPKEEPGAPQKDTSAVLASPGKRTQSGAGSGTGDEVVSTSMASSTTQGSEQSSQQPQQQFRTAVEVGNSSLGSDAVQEDMEQLRQENLLLNEQILRLKMTIESAQTGRDSAASKSFQNNPYAPPASSVMQLQQQQKTVFIVAGVMLALLGILIGKFVL